MVGEGGGGDVIERAGRVEDTGRNEKNLKW